MVIFYDQCPCQKAGNKTECNVDKENIKGIFKIINPSVYKIMIIKKIVGKHLNNYNIKSW